MDKVNFLSLSLSDHLGAEPSAPAGGRTTILLANCCLGYGQYGFKGCHAAAVHKNLLEDAFREFEMVCRFHNVSQCYLKVISSFIAKTLGEQA